MDYVFFKKIDVKVTGYAGTINRIFQKKQEDLQQIIRLQNQ